ncbi:unnamed protein product [Cylindrotheca closterium]|uniref:Uncharacterized protein n=1 Tax=Cylindrotheca closterium TaxID=2856 RepID=A0AAD2GB48_9STRA|nr:unnamed protein product [Cylindrotheca closterium]
MGPPRMVQGEPSFPRRSSDGCGEDETCWAPEVSVDLPPAEDGPFMEADERYQLAEPDPGDEDVGEDEGPQEFQQEGWIQFRIFEGVDSPSKFIKKRRSLVLSGSS